VLESHGVGLCSEIVVAFELCGSEIRLNFVSLNNCFQTQLFRERLSCGAVRVADLGTINGRREPSFGVGLACKSLGVEETDLTRIHSADRHRVFTYRSSGLNTERALRKAATRNCAGGNSLVKYLRWPP
jgi:hypothetical protein